MPKLPGSTFVCSAVLLLGSASSSAWLNHAAFAAEPTSVAAPPPTGVAGLEPIQAAESWPTFRGDSRRTGRSDMSGPATPATRWAYDMGNLAYASPALDENGTVYAASMDSVHAVTASGRRLWATAVDGVISSPALSGGTVYVGARDGSLYALSMADGSVRWRFTTGNEIWASPAVGADGTVYVGSLDGNVYAVNGANGQQRWAFATGSEVFSSVAIGADGTLYVGSTNGSLYALTPEGARIWEFPADDEIVSSPAVGDDGTVYVGSLDGRLYAVRPDGTLRWKYPEDNSTALSRIISSPAVTPEGAVYIASIDGRLHAISPTGSRRWAPVQMDGPAISSPTIDDGGTVLIGSMGGTLYAVDGAQGTTRWTHHLGGAIWSSPALGPGRIAYVAAYDSLSFSGGLYAVGTTAVQVTPTEEADANQPVTIEVILTEDVQAASGSLFYRRAGERTYQSPIAFQQGSGNAFSAVIPAEFSTLRGIEYYVRFEGGAQVFTFPIFEPETRPAFQAVRVASCTPEAGACMPDLEMRPRIYRMISVPLDLDDPSVGSVLDEYGPPALTSWRLFRWKEDGYQEYPQFSDVFEPGAAFFLVTQDGEEFTIEDGTSVSAAVPYRITLAPGLNQIGNPFAFPVAWADVTRSPDVQIIAFFDSEANQMVQDPARLQVLQPWQGYFVRNPSSVPVTIAIPPREAGGASAGARPALTASPSEAVSFNVQARVIGTDLQDTQNWLGTAATADAGDDPMDRVEAPPIGDFVRLSLLEEGRRYAINYKPLGAQGQTWDAELAVSGPEAGRLVEIRYAPSAALPPGMGLYVVDLDSRSMLPAANGRVEAALPEDGSPRRLRFVLGTRAFAEDPSNTFGTPGRFEVGQNFPNPFRAGTSIRYFLDAEAPVTVTIYDLLGRAVATLVDETQQAGWHVVSWDGRASGGGAPAGMYFYRVTAGSQSATRTMLLVD